jgi:hypothetical protein
MLTINAPNNKTRPVDGVTRDTFVDALAFRIFESWDNVHSSRSPGAAAAFMSIAIVLIEESMLNPNGGRESARTSMHTIYSMWRGWCGDQCIDVQPGAYQVGFDARCLYNKYAAGLVSP